jgi:hypothetical protein
MAIQPHSGDVTPHILIISGDPAVRDRLGHIFQPRDISYEAPSLTKDALMRLEEGTGPVPTGIVTEGLQGRYTQVIEAAQRIGAATVLLTRSSLIKKTAAQNAGVSAYFTSEIVGKTEGNKTIAQLIASLLTK